MSGPRRFIKETRAKFWQGVPRRLRYLSLHRVSGQLAPHKCNLMPVCRDVRGHTRPSPRLVTPPASSKLPPRKGRRQDLTWLGHGRWPEWRQGFEVGLGRALPAGGPLNAPQGQLWSGARPPRSRSRVPTPSLPIAPEQVPVCHLCWPKGFEWDPHGVGSPWSGIPLSPSSICWTAARRNAQMHKIETPRGTAAGNFRQVLLQLRLWRGLSTRTLDV